MQYVCNIYEIISGMFDTFARVCYSGGSTGGPPKGGLNMGLFNDAGEQERKANLKRLEDKRLAFAQRMAEQGFQPERMLFAQTPEGGLTALCRHGGQYCLILGPSFASEEDFQLERYDRLDYRVENVDVKGEGMGGIFGFGKKPESGVEYVIARHDGSEARMSFVCNRGGWLECALKKNPLLSPKRRRGDANVVWELHPIDASGLRAALKLADQYFG